MRVVVTGVAGFIGSHVSEALLSRGDEVLGIDNFNPFYDPAIKRRNAAAVAATGGPRFHLVEGDLRHFDTVRRAIADFRADAICHLAAWAGVRPSIERPRVYQANNLEATQHVLEVARAEKIAPFVFASSSSVYGARAEVPFCEDDRVDDPVSPYAATKKAGELMGYTYHHLFGLRFVGLRFFTVYGPRQRPEMAIHLFARKILEGRPIPVFGDGSTSRDYTYIDDIVAGVVASIDRAARVPGYRIYNLGGSETTSLSELIARLEDAIGRPAIVDRRPEQPGDVPRTFADVTRAKAELGYRPETPIRAGIPKFVEWLKAQP